MMRKFCIILIFFSFLIFSTVNAEDSEAMIIKLKVNDNVFDVKLENNSATQELIETLKNGDVVVNASDYGNFEKVGDLGFSLPTEDKNINTAPGDIVLYQGNQLSLFYKPHSWSYTKIGNIENTDNLKEILGPGDVSLTFTLD